MLLKYWQKLQAISKLQELIGKLKFAKFVIVFEKMRKATSKYVYRL